MANVGCYSHIWCPLTICGVADGIPWQRMVSEYERSWVAVEHRVLADHCTGWCPRVRVRVRVKGVGVTSKEIDPTWRCDSIGTRDAAPQVCPRSRETTASALSGV